VGYISSALFSRASSPTLTANYSLHAPARARLVRGPQPGGPMRVTRLVLPTLFLIATISVPATFAQTTPDLEEGMKPYGDFNGGDIDQVSLSSGKLVDIATVKIPIGL